MGLVGVNKMKEHFIYIPLNINKPLNGFILNRFITFSVNYFKPLFVVNVLQLIKTSYSGSQKI